MGKEMLRELFEEKKISSFQGRKEKKKVDTRGEAPSTSHKKGRGCGKDGRKNERSV